MEYLILLLCLLNKQTKHPNNYPKMTKNYFHLEEVFLVGELKLSTSRTQQKDCWLFHSAGMLYKITYILIWNKMSQQFSHTSPVFYKYLS